MFFTVAVLPGGVFVVAGAVYTVGNFIAGVGCGVVGGGALGDAPGFASGGPVDIFIGAGAGVVVGNVAVWVVVEGGGDAVDVGLADGIGAGVGGGAVLVAGDVGFFIARTVAGGFAEDVAVECVAGGGGSAGCAQAAEVVVGEVFGFGLPCLAAAAF